MSENPVLVFRFSDEAGAELANRSKRMVRTGPPLQLTGTGRSIQFLRGVFSRASMCLPAFYYFLGSASDQDSAASSEDYAFRVAQTYSKFSDLNTLTLNCRKIFDSSVAVPLTGANFAKSSDSVLMEHAAYWAKVSERSEEHAFSALKFLRRFFSECSRTDTHLLKADGQLQKRIGLLKQHADRTAAHLSLENYELDIVDLVHFTGACVVIGEIIRSFDSPHLGDSYFNLVDTGSYQAARKVFPGIAKFKLFHHMKVETQARLYWQWGEDQGLDAIYNQLQHALGGDPDRPGRVEG